jgi:2-aminoadipate transaminase
MNPSVIREILKVTEKPGIISFRRRPALGQDLSGRGIRPRLRQVLRDDASAALQYAASEGYSPWSRWWRKACPGTSTRPAS